MVFAVKLRITFFDALPFFSFFTLLYDFLALLTLILSKDHNGRKVDLIENLANALIALKGLVAHFKTVSVFSF